MRLFAGIVVFVAATVALVGYGASRMNYTWKWDQVPRHVVRIIDGAFYPGALLKGLAVTLAVWSFLRTLDEAEPRGIDDAFEKYRARKKKTGQQVNSLAYCAQAVTKAASCRSE